MESQWIHDFWLATCIAVQEALRLSPCKRVRPISVKKESESNSTRSTTINAHDAAAP
jgi:hypothetical protein